MCQVESKHSPASNLEMILGLKGFVGKGLEGGGWVFQESKWLPTLRLQGRTRYTNTTWTTHKGWMRHFPFGVVETFLK